jgi:hypothetical protein
MLAEALEQLVDQPGLGQCLAKQPNRGGIRHRVLEFQIEKAHSLNKAIALAYAVRSGLTAPEALGDTDNDMSCHVMPDAVLELMKLYPQPVRTQGGGVEYLPVPRRNEPSGREGMWYRH